MQSRARGGDDLRTNTKKIGGVEDEPKDTEELLHAIATKDYGVSQDRSWSKVYPKAIQTYNRVADSYHQSLQKHGQPLHENFWIVKVQSPACTSPAIWWGGHPTRSQSPACTSPAIWWGGQPTRSQSPACWDCSPPFRMRALL